MSARKLGVALACVLAISTSSAAAHSNIPKAWWLDQKTAMSKLRTAVKPRYQPAAFKSLTGLCRGLVPRATPAGRSVYKHFACDWRLSVNGFNYSFSALVHVIGPHGRIRLGG